MSEPILSQKQVKYSRITLGAGLALAAFFMLLCGVNAVPISPLKALAPAILFAACLVCLAWAKIQRSTLMLYLSAFLLVFALAATLSIWQSFGEYYPIFIFAPAFASLETALIKGNWRYHIAPIAIFSVATLLLLLSSLSVASYKITLPILLLLCGVAVLIHALLIKEREEEE